MFSGVVLFFLLVSFLPLQIPRGIQSHYEKAEELRRKGDLTAAEAEYDLILGEGYLELARVRSAQADYITAVNFFETAARYRPVRNDFLIESAIAYFHAEQYDKSLTTLNGV